VVSAQIESGRRGEAGIDRRTALQTGAGALVGSILAQQVAVQPTAAQQQESWPIQQFDRANTGSNPDGTPLRNSPETLVQQDVPAGHPANYLVANGTLYLHSAENGLGAIEVGSGEVEWIFEEADTPLIPEFVEGDVLVARSLGGNIFAIDRSDGSLTAGRPTEQGYGMAPGTSGRWFAPVSEGRVVAGEADSNEPVWETPVEGTGVRPAFADGRVFVSTVELPPEEINFENPAGIDGGGRLYALDAEDGSVLWDRTRVGGGLAPPTVHDGTVYWTGTDGDILTNDAKTGDSGWELKTDSSFNTPVAITDDHLFAGNDDGGLYVIDTESGERLRRIPIGDPLYAGPVVVGNVVYAGTTTGTVVAVDTENGNLQWEFEADTPIRALTVWENRAVVGTDSGYYVLGDGEATTRTASDGNTGGDQTGGSDAGSDEFGDNTNGADSGTDSEERQRGFFSNDGNEPESLSNAFNLTMLGFLLSVAGIVHQMIQGR
jgi:outer membrane protein assembly factor BamB